MIEAEQAHDEKIVTNVTHMQAKADEAVTNLREQLAKLHAIALTAVAGAGGIAASEAELYSELSREKLARADLQAQLDRVKAEHDKCPMLIASLRKQIKETKDALDQDDFMLEQTKCKVIKIDEEIKSKAPTPKGRVKLGAGARGGPTLPLPDETEEEKEVLDKKLYTGTFMGIADLRNKLGACA